MARKEAFEVTPQEIDIAISQMAMQTRQPFHNLKQYYEEHGLIVPLRDRLLADKAMEFIFENAKVIEVDAPAAEEEGGEEADAKAPAKKAAAKAPAKKAPAKKPAAKKPAAKKSADESGDKE